MICLACASMSVRFCTSATRSFSRFWASVRACSASASACCSSIVRCSMNSAVRASTCSRVRWRARRLRSPMNESSSSSESMAFRKNVTLSKFRLPGATSRIWKNCSLMKSRSAITTRFRGPSVTQSDAGSSTSSASSAADSSSPTGSAAAVSSAASTAKSSPADSDASASSPPAGSPAADGGGPACLTRAATTKSSSSCSRTGLGLIEGPKKLCRTSEKYPVCPDTRPLRSNGSNSTSGSASGPSAGRRNPGYRKTSSCRSRTTSTPGLNVSGFSLPAPRKTTSDGMCDSSGCGL